MHGLVPDQRHYFQAGRAGKDLAKRTIRQSSERERADFRSNLCREFRQSSCFGSVDWLFGGDVRTGQVLCRQGDPGNTAFIIRDGSLKS